MIFGSTKYSQLSETKAYCTCGRIDAWICPTKSGREGRTSQLCITNNRMFKAQPATRHDGFTAPGSEMPPCHAQRGIFCDISIIRYSTIEVYSALENVIETQPLFKSQGDPKSIYVHLYASINTHRYVFKLTCRHSN